MQKLSPELAGKLGEILALSKFVSVGLHAYASPPGAPGHDIMVVTPNGPKSVEVKTRQYVDKPSEISRWPVDMNTKSDADFFLFVELNLRTVTPTFYLLNNGQAKAVYQDYNGSGNCLPAKVRVAVSRNDFSVLTGEPTEISSVQSDTRPATSKLTTSRFVNRQSMEIIQEVTFDVYRVVQYASQKIDVFVDGAVQNNAIERLRKIATPLGVSKYNNSGGLRNTRQLGKVVIEAIKDRE